jgi:hypothetical protein
MTTVRHLGSANPANPFPTLERRSISVNTANRQIAVGDEAAGSPGAPLPMLAVRYFDARAQYVINDVVIQGGILYRAKGAIPPGAFNATQWTVSDNSGSVLKAGDTMSGHLSLPTGPAAANAVRKDYVDAADLLKADKTYVDAQDALRLAKAGDSMTGVLNTKAATTGINSTAVDTITVWGLAGAAAAIFYNVPGSFSCNMGLGSDGNFYMSGGNHGVTIYRFWTTKDFNYTPVNKAGDTVSGRLSVGTSGQTSPGFNNTATGNVLNPAETAFFSSPGASAVFNTNVVGITCYYNCIGITVGSISVTNTATAYNTSSDGRLKEDLRALSTSEVAAIIDGTEVYDFKWKQTGERAYGVIAQQAAPIYATPAFHDKETDRWFIDYSKYVPVLLREMQALRARVAELEVLAGMRPAPPEAPKTKR